MTVGGRALAKLTAEEQAKLTRRTLIDIAMRRQRPGSGSAPWRGEGVPVLRWPDLTDILDGVPWAVAGGVATRRYMPERSTLDLDVVVLTQDLAEVKRRFERANYSFTGLLAIGGSSWETPEGVPVDVIEGREPWWPEALSEADTNRDSLGTPVLTLRFLVLMKVRSGRMQDATDVGRMVTGASADQIAAVRALVRRYAPDFVEDLESMLALARLERGEDA
jgi:hypothetical protein